MTPKPVKLVVKTKKIKKRINESNEYGKKKNHVQIPTINKVKILNLITEFNYL
jgi:hypothetical protein